MENSSVHPFKNLRICKIMGHFIPCSSEKQANNPCQASHIKGGSSDLHMKIYNAHVIIYPWVTATQKLFPIFWKLVFSPSGVWLRPIMPNI